MDTEAWRLATTSSNICVPCQEGRKSPLRHDINKQMLMGANPEPCFCRNQRRASPCRIWILRVSTGAYQYHPHGPAYLTASCYGGTQTAIPHAGQGWRIASELVRAYVGYSDRRSDHVEIFCIGCNLPILGIIFLKDTGDRNVLMHPSAGRRRQLIQDGAVIQRKRRFGIGRDWRNSQISFTIKALVLSASGKTVLSF